MRYLLAIIASALSSFAIAQSGLYNENYRPQFHFSPAKNWLNDPNGLIYQDGVYHLFYQYNPLGTKWGHMSWGHSITKDLIHWKELPVALNEINDTMIFSGSAVIDKNNSAGFAKNANDAALVAIYTAHQENRQCQYSLDASPISVGDDVFYRFLTPTRQPRPQLRIFQEQ